MKIAQITGSEVMDWILAILGNLFLAFLAIRIIAAWMKDEWGKGIGILVGGLLVAAIIYLPEQFKNFLLGLWKLLVGGS